MTSSPTLALPVHVQSSFRGREVRINQYRWHAQASRDWQFVEAVAPAVLAVSDGTATVVRDQRTTSLLDPAQAIALRAGDAVRLHGSVQNKHTPTVYVITTLPRPGQPAGPDSVPDRGSGGTAEDAFQHLPLSASALFSFHRLQRLLELVPSSGVPCSDAARIETHALRFLAKAWPVRDTRPGNARLPDSRGAGRARRIAEGARALMAARPEAPHRLADMARALETSPFHLAHVFRDEIGVPPHRYLVRLRVISALHHLVRGVTDLSRLSLELGFASHSHFSVAFRQVFGVTPREARRLLAGVWDGQDANVPGYVHDVERRHPPL